MKELIDSKTVIKDLLNKNKLLYLENLDQKRMIDELMYKVEQLESDLEYSKVNGGIRKLVLRKTA